MFLSLSVGVSHLERNLSFSLVCGKEGGYCALFLFLMCSPSSLFRHRRAIQKSRGSKVRRAEGTMESEPGAPASTANSTGTTTTTSSTSTTTAASSSSTSNATTTTATTSAISGHSSSSSSGGSNTSSTTSSTTTGRQAVPQISVYSGIPDRQTVQVSGLDVKPGHYYMQAHLNHMYNLHAQKLSYFMFHCCPLLV